MNIHEKVQIIVERFSRISDWESKYKEMITLGKALPAFDETVRLDKFKVKGCQSQVWLVPTFKEGKIFFQADSDSVLVKGIIALLLEVYSGESPSDILITKADFLTSIGLMENLTMNRSNGLTSMIKQIQMYAMVFKTMEAK
ncbi:MAG: SufE family protein [Bacteriovoracaceae bacterium]